MLLKTLPCVPASWLLSEAVLKLYLSLCCMAASLSWINSVIYLAWSFGLWGRAGSCEIPEPVNSWAGWGDEGRFTSPSLPCSPSQVGGTPFSACEHCWVHWCVFQTPFPVLMHRNDWTLCWNNFRFTTMSWRQWGPFLPTFSWHNTHHLSMFVRLRDQPCVDAASADFWACICAKWILSPSLCLTLSLSL